MRGECQECGDNAVLTHVDPVLGYLCRDCGELAAAVEIRPSPGAMGELNPELVISRCSSADGRMADYMAAFVVERDGDVSQCRRLTGREHCNLPNEAMLAVARERYQEEK